MLTLLSVVAFLVPQNPAAAPGAAPPGPAARFVDFSDEFDQPGFAAVLGTLGKLKEGKRERLENGQLGGAGAVASVSGTQYYKAPVTAPIEPRKLLAGAAPGKPVLQFEVQIARLPDGKERRQLTAGNAAPVAEGALGLFVIDAGNKSKGTQLRHLVAFDARAFPGADGETAFADAMSDVVAVNRHMHALEQALAAVDAAKGDDAVSKAKAALQGLVDRRPEMLRTDDDALLAMHVAPLEQRAKKRLQ